MLEQGGAAGVPLALIPQLRRPVHPWRDVSSYAAIRRILRDFQPDVVHTHSAKGGFLGRLAAAAIHAPVIVHTVHGAPFHPYQSIAARTLIRWCERFAAGKCHALVSVADAMTDLLVEAGVAPRERFTTIYSGMEIEPFLAADQHRDATRSALGYGPEHVVVGKIARMFPLKGHPHLIAAAKQVVKRRPEVRFLLVGDGVLRPSLESQVCAAGLQDRFQFLGLTAPQRIPSLLGAMDVLVHVSLREGLARALPQALIAGKPVVSYDVDGAREVAIPGETGYLAPPRSIGPLADALIELAGDPELRRRLGLQGRARFADQFRYERMTEQLRALYSGLLDQRRR